MNVLAGASWDGELAEVGRLAEDAMQEHLAVAMDGNAAAVAIVQNAKTASLLVRLLQGIRQPTEGDRRILLKKAETLRALLRN